MSPEASARRPGASAAAIRAHYDAGNAFFAEWLDARMIYSAARWGGSGAPATSLDEAQTRKLDWHLDAAGCGAGSRLLDVGCGWGALVARAVARGAAAATGITPSGEQVAWIVRHHADPRIAAIRALWQTAEFDRPFDAAVSIGALEHFARPGLGRAGKVSAYRDFFAFCRRNLVPGGRLSLQFIGWMEIDPQDEVRHLPRELFPESNLPRLDEVIEASRGRFHAMAMENVPSDYARTLRAWLSRLGACRGDMARRHGAARVTAHVRGFRRFALGFEAGTLGLYRVAFRMAGKDGT